MAYQNTAYHRGFGLSLLIVGAALAGLALATFLAKARQERIAAGGGASTNPLNTLLTSAASTLQHGSQKIIDSIEHSRR